jgi:dihydrofolate synthase/folylpolyglutamate synthase
MTVREQTAFDVAALLSLPRFGAGVGLHRALWLCRDAAGEAWEELPSGPKVTGSNGKGSVVAYTGALLSALGLRTVTFVSPHLLDFSERIAVDGQPIGAADLRDHLAWLGETLAYWRRERPADTVAAFEAITALAVRHVARVRPDTVVWEAGIGGRFDPTRVLPGDCVALTALDHEHTALLGDTLEQIAHDKADLCPDGGTLVVGDIDEDVLFRLRFYAKVRGLAVRPLAHYAGVRRVGCTAGRWSADVRLGGVVLDDVTFAAAGAHQVHNALLAGLLVRCWLERRDRPVPDELFAAAFRATAARVQPPFRFEQVAAHPPVWVDLAHTPAAARVAAETARTTGLTGGRTPGAGLVLVTGVSADKDAAAILAALAPLARHVVCTRARHRGRPAAEVEAAVRAARPGVPTTATDDLAAALADARTRAKAAGVAVLVTGGLFLAVEAAVLLRGGDPGALRFL